MCPGLSAGFYKPLGAQWEKNAGIKAPGPFAAVSKKTKALIKVALKKNERNPPAPASLSFSSGDEHPRLGGW